VQKQDIQKKYYSALVEWRFFLNFTLVLFQMTQLYFGRFTKNENDQKSVDELKKRFEVDKR